MKRSSNAAANNISVGNIALGNAAIGNAAIGRAAGFFAVITMAMTVSTAALSDRVAAIDASGDSGVEPLELVTDEGFTNDLHEEKPGVVHFGKKKIERSSPDRKVLKSKFKIGDPIFIRVLMDGSFENNFRKKGMACSESNDVRRMLLVYVNGSDEPVYLEDRNMDFRDWADWTSFTTKGAKSFTRKAALYPVTNEPADEAPYFFWAEIAPQLRAGKNKLRFDAVGQCNAKLPDGSYDANHRVVMAKGELTLDAPKKKLRAQLKKNGPKFPKSKLSKKVTKEMMKTAQRMWSNEKIIKASAADTWTVVRDPVHGHPTHRVTRGYLITKLDGEKTCRIWNNGFEQQAKRKGVYTKKMTMSTGSPDAFPCPK